MARSVSEFESPEEKRISLTICQAIQKMPEGFQLTTEQVEGFVMFTLGLSQPEVFLPTKNELIRQIGKHSLHPDANWVLTRI